MTYIPNVRRTRRAFKGKLQEHLGGALLEFYKAKLAIKNGKSRWVAHWMREVSDLSFRAMTVFMEPIQGFRDKARAFEEVADQLKKYDRSYRTSATNIVRKDFGGDRLRVQLSDNDTDEFWLMVADVANATKD